MAEPGLPLISILTPSFNQARYIEQTITSVLDQAYTRLEHIVVDGGSTDQTISILKRYPHVKWISEPDGGQSDALNKGLLMATGDLVGWINSDDFYAPGAFNRVYPLFQDETVGWVVGDVTNYYHQSGIEKNLRSAAVTYDSLLRNPDILRQPGTFFRASLLRTAGGWDPSLHMVMDLDLWLRLARISAPCMLQETTAYWRIHPEQKSSSEISKLQRGEIDRVLSRHGVSQARRWRQLGKKRWWGLKSTIKNSLIRTGLLSTTFRN